MPGYEDIIHLSRPVSTRHARMSMADRGAQFAPFAALTGYESVLEESARLTEAETFLDESGKELLNRKLRCLADHLEAIGPVRFLCYQEDGRKAGGRYVWLTGTVKKLTLTAALLYWRTDRNLPSRTSVPSMGWSVSRCEAV